MEPGCATPANNPRVGRSQLPIVTSSTFGGDGDYLALIQDLQSLADGDDIRLTAMQGDGLRHPQHPAQHGDIPAFSQHHPMQAPRLQVSIEYGDFQDINVIGVDNQWPVLRDSLLGIIDAADQAGDAF